MKRLVNRVLVLTLLFFAISGCTSNNSDYDKAVELQEAGDYAGAIELYQSIDNYDEYKDTADRIEECNYMIAQIDAFKVELLSAESVNGSLSLLIYQANDLLAGDLSGVDDALVQDLENAVSEAEAALQLFEDDPLTMEDIDEYREQLDTIDFSALYNNLSEVLSAVESSTDGYAY